MRDPASPGSGGAGGGNDAGGQGGAATSATGNGGNGTGTAAGGAPVECVDGVPAGAPCAPYQEGETCDSAGSPCTATCTDGTWVETCVECPDALPDNVSVRRTASPESGRSTQPRPS